jgi:hypothetical protein
VEKLVIYEKGSAELGTIHKESATKSKAVALSCKLRNIGQRKSRLLFD